jgi:hypothetical protein
MALPRRLRTNTKQQSVILVIVDRMLSFSSEMKLALVGRRETLVECEQFIVFHSEQLNKYTVLLTVEPTEVMALGLRNYK